MWVPEGPAQNIGNNNIYFPEGISTEIIFEEITPTNSYVVDPGKRLYITHVSIDNPTSTGLKIDNLPIIQEED